MLGADSEYLYLYDVYGKPHLKQLHVYLKMEEGVKITDFIGPPKLTKFEKARIIGTRALQIALGAPLLINIDDKTAKPIDLATKELEAGILPITIKRKLPDGTFVYIPLQKLTAVEEKKISKK